MKKTHTKYIVIALFVAIVAAQTHAAGIVQPGTSTLADNGTSASPAEWTLDGDYTSPDGSVFTVSIYDGGPGSYNHLTVANGQTLTASSGLSVGDYRAYGGLLDIQAGAAVAVNGSATVGNGTTMYYSRYHRINVTGAGAVLSVTGDLDISDGYNATDNYLSLSDGAVAIVDSDKDGSGTFSLYNHWSYGNCWLELDGGSLLLFGDKTADFASGQGILSSIKVWDEAGSSLVRVAHYQSTTLIEDNMDLLGVDYIQDAATAAALGYSSDYVGFTVVHNIPEPATLSLLAIGGLLLRRKK